MEAIHGGRYQGEPSMPLGQIKQLAIDPVHCRASITGPCNYLHVDWSELDCIELVTFLHHGAHHHLKRDFVDDGTGGSFRELNQQTCSSSLIYVVVISRYHLTRHLLQILEHLVFKRFHIPAFDGYRLTAFRHILHAILHRTIEVCHLFAFY